ncbi:uroporphyrin-3 C-methyltransferase [Azomonas agilis]|uniref:Uroporphyrin-3 C-methyltransferase n=1 Tax=Azomonas agilis TaxID=116849 RepID=A0A562J2V0_9GAMM|nr:uroporphyrinogen-III C-methyltransferase [Azomonas agilis]TWH77452.1 uroporphyrin-3 C-methyltransferase [Azomonas agilis]
MSEADNQKDLKKEEPVAEQSAASPPPPVQAQPPRSSGGSGLSTLALLVGLAASGAAGYVFYLNQLQQQHFDAQAQQISQQIEQLGRQSTAANPATTSIINDQNRKLSQLAEFDLELNARLDRLPSLEELEDRRRALVKLQSDQQHLASRVEKVLGASREDWRLAEAEHLLRMAMLRLSAMQDVKSAAALINESDLILQKQDDPGAYGARQKLLDSLEALRSVPELDRTGLFLQLGALRGLTASLTSTSPQFKADGTSTANPVEDKKTWQYWVNELARYVRIDLDSVNGIKPLLAGQSLGQVRLALALAVEQAQWAVLNGNTEVYRQSLKQAHDLIMEHFTDKDLESRAVAERIKALVSRQVSVTLPDLTPALRAMEAYVQERQNATSGGAEKGKKAAKVMSHEDPRT